MVRRGVQFLKPTRGLGSSFLRDRLAAILGQVESAGNGFWLQEDQVKLVAEARYTVRTKRTKTTTELTVEQETFVALRGMRRQRGWCNQCSTETSLATPEEAAAVSRVSVIVIY